jgi:hypothetical protein
MPGLSEQRGDIVRAYAIGCIMSASRGDIIMHVIMADALAVLV